jgi:hypothetical protein
MQYHAVLVAVPCSIYAVLMQYRAVPCSTMQYRAVLVQYLFRHAVAVPQYHLPSTDILTIGTLPLHAYVYGSDKRLDNVLHEWIG